MRLILTELQLYLCGAPRGTMGNHGSTNPVGKGRILQMTFQIRGGFQSPYRVSSCLTPVSTRA
jgi:hypothetical protein